MRWLLYTLVVCLWACGGEGHSVESAGAAEQETVPAYTFPLADKFDFPVGPPDGKGYYDAQPFGKNNHLGSDWNGLGGGNTDLGDPVFAIGNGWVSGARNVRGGWGKVVRVVHNRGTAEKPILLESLYAHLDSMWVKEGDTVFRGDQIGTIGNADGVYLAHLHFEVRERIGMPLGGGYSQETDGYLDPTVFLKGNRSGK